MKNFCIIEHGEFGESDTVINRLGFDEALAIYDREDGISRSMYKHVIPSQDLINKYHEFIDSV